MKRKSEPGRTAAHLCVAWLGLVSLSSARAQEPKLRTTLEGHEGAVVAVAFSPDSKTVASASHDGAVKLWDIATGKERATLGNEYRGCLGCVAFSIDGKTVASGAIGSPFPLPDLQEVKLWDVSTGKLRTRLKARDYYVYSVAFSPDGKTLASLHGDVTLWDLATNKKRATLEAYVDENRPSNEPVHGVESVAFSPDGKMLAAAANFERAVNVWDLATRERSVLLGHTRSVCAVAFRSDSKILASASGDKTIRLWDLRTNKERAVLRGHADSVLSVAFSPDGKSLASASSDTTVKLWDAATGKERFTLKGTQWVTSVAFSPDGRMLAAAGGSEPGALRVWDLVGTK